MAPRHALVLAAALAATWSLGSAASAQTVAPAAPAPSAPPATYDDVVILKSGARYRGVIGELVPNDHVEILLATGQTRSLAMSDVLYAGPLAKAPEAAAAPGQVARPTVAFPAPSHEGGVSFEAVALSGPLGPHAVALGEVTADVVGARGIGLAYNKLCDAPCQPSLAAGPHRLVVILGRGVVSGLTSLDIPAEPSTLRATVDRHPGLRTAGLATMLGGVIGGTALTLGVVLAHTDKGPPVGELLIGPAVIVVGLAAGIGLLVASVDHAKLELLPGLPAVATLAPAPSQRELAQGATLRLRF